MESNSITTPVADTPSAPSIEAGSLRTKIISEKNRSRGRNDVLRAAAKTPIEGPTGTPREIRKALRNRFGRKPFNPQRVARRFPLHEVIAARSLAMTVPHDFADEVLTGVVASNGHRVDRVGELVSLAALLEGLRRNGGGLEEERLAPLWADAWRSTYELSEATAADDSPLAQVLAAEVLFASSILFEDDKKLRARRKDARVRLIGELESRTDTDGTPHAGLLPVLSAWFASLARCTRWADVAGVRLWNSEYSDRFDGLLRAVSTMTASNSFAFCALGDMRPLLGEAIKSSGWKSGSPVGRLVRRIAKSDDEESVPSRESSPHKIDRSSPPASQSDWGKLVISRTRWSADADVLVLAHHAAIPAIEFAAFGRRIFSGAWGFLVKIDDAEFVLPNDCDAVCWFSDADADYVELQWTTEPEIVICRQAMLTRGDHQLFLADSVSVPSRPEARVEIQSSLPLANHTTAELLRPERELRLNAGGLPIRCIPMTLPMDHLVRGGGAVVPDNDRLVVRHSGLGSAYAPLLFDWHPQRRTLPADWRNLTVTEDGRKVGPQAGLGARVRIGKRQLLVYRNLNASKLKRAVLGHHHDHETVIGRFTSDGEVEPLVLVE